MRSRRAITVLGTALLLAAGVAVALYWNNRRDVTTSSEEAYRAYRQAVENERRFYFKEARIGFARALELDPEFAMAILGLARYSEREQALSLVRRARRLRNRLNAREQLHVDLHSAGLENDREAASRIAREIRKRFPEDFGATMYLARQELSNGNTEKAIQIFSDLLAVDPNNAEAYNQVGYYYAYRGNYAKAIENLKKYQFMAPDQANPHDSLGEVLAYAGRYDEAVGNLEKALSVKPDFWAAFLHLGVVYEGKGEYARAIANYLKAADLAATEPIRMRALGGALRVAFISRDRGAAGSIYARIEAMPKNPYTKLGEPLYEAGRDLMEGRAAEAERRLAEAKPKLYAAMAERLKSTPYKPYEAGWNYLMATALVAQGKEEEAIPLYQEMANPPNGWHTFEDRLMVYEGRAHLAALLAKKGDLDRAEKLLEENRKWNPTWAPTREPEATVARLRRERVLTLGTAADARTGGKK